jgi:hypothetical protein
MFDLITSIVVDLSDQKLYAYNGAELVRAIAVSSGKAGTPTPTFSSQVQSKHETVTMRGRDYVAPGVPWALCLDGGMICLHGGGPLAGGRRGGLWRAPQPWLCAHGHQASPMALPTG